MGLLKGKVLSFVLALVVGGPLAHANSQEEILPMAPNDVRVAYQVQADALIKVLGNTEGMTQEQIRAVEDQVEELREKLDELLEKLTRAGGAPFILGVVVTYGLDYDIPIPNVGKLGFGPGVEVGFAGFLKKEEVLTQALRGTGVFIPGATVDIGRDASNPVRRRGVAHGLSLKLLLGTSDNLRTPASLTEFSGAYVGAGGEFNLPWLPAAIGGRAFVKGEDCDLYNPLSYGNCKAFMVSLQGSKGDQRVQAGVTTLWLNFVLDNDGRGHHF